MSHFIATGHLNTNDGHNVDRTIYGVGKTADAAIADARSETQNPSGEFTVTPCTTELHDAVVARGSDVRWHLVQNVADLDR